jgi:hypothetical protein
MGRLFSPGLAGLISGFALGFLGAAGLTGLGLDLSAGGSLALALFGALVGGQVEDRCSAVS